MSRLTKIVILMTSALQYVKLEDETQTSLESGETLPQPSALASPERSSLDEEQYNMAASWLKHRFSIPQHLVPSYQDTVQAGGRSQLHDVNLANHRTQPDPLQQRKAQKDPNAFSSIIYENYDDSGEFYDYDFADDNWSGGDKSLRNHNPHFNTKIEHPNHAPRYRRVGGRPRPSPPPSLYRDILQSKIRGQSTSTFRGDWVKPKAPNRRNRNRKNPTRPQYPRGQNIYNQRRRKGPDSGRPLRTGGKSNILSSIVKQVKDSISTVFAGARRQPAFPRIQYGPLHFGPPLKKFPSRPRYSSQDLDYYYDYQDYGDTSRIDRYDYLYYDDYYDQYNNNPAVEKLNTGKSQRKEVVHNTVGDKIVNTLKAETVSPTSGEITVVSRPEPTSEGKQIQGSRRHREGTKDKSHQYEESQESAEYESSPIYEEIDYNDIFDDVIDTTVNPMVEIQNLAGNVAWGEDMWDEVSRDFKRVNKKARQKVKVRVQRKPMVSSTRGTRGTRGTSRPRTAEDEAKRLSIWAAAERVSQDAPSIRFDDGQNIFQKKLNKLNSLQLQRSQRRKLTTTSPPTQPDREFYEGFQPSKKDNSQRMNNFMSQTFHDSQQTPNLSNHQTSSSSLYDKKMIIDFPKPTPASLPMMSRQSPFNLQTFTREPVRTRTRTLQELTLGSH